MVIRQIITTILVFTFITVLRAEDYDLYSYESLTLKIADTSFYLRLTDWDVKFGGTSGYELKIYSNKDSASVTKGDSVLFVYDIKKKYFITTTISYTDAFLIVMEILSKSF